MSPGDGVTLFSTSIVVKIYTHNLLKYDMCVKHTYISFIACMVYNILLVVLLLPHLPV